MTPNVRPWGMLSTGAHIDLITLEGPKGAIAQVSTLGGIIRSLVIPLSIGERRQVVLGFETIAEYEADTESLGATVGPYANRIRGGAFSLDGARVQLLQNEGEHTLHGGHFWRQAVYGYEIEGDTLVLRHKSPDGEGGFPGNREVTIRYAWREPMSFEMKYTVTTDRPTVVSMTNHSYFCLAPGADAFAHRLQIQADFYTPNDEQSIPTGEIRPVDGTAFDFRTMRPIARHYDQNFVLSPGAVPAAILQAPDGSLSMAMHTDMPGMQVYTSEFLKPPFKPGAAVSLEPQHFPDAPNNPQFPRAVITPTRPYQSQTTLVFFE